MTGMLAVVKNRGNLDRLSQRSHEDSVPGMRRPFIAPRCFLASSASRRR